MATEGRTFDQWLRGAKVSPEELSDQQRAVLHAAFQFLNRATGTIPVVGSPVISCSVAAWD